MHQSDPEDQVSESRPRGRPRSERARRAILDAAAHELFAHGVAAITVDAIAERAGVSKATIYKWWPSKAAIAVDAFLETVEPQLPSPDVGDVHRELAEPAIAQLRLFRDTPVGFALASIVAAAQSDPDVAEAFRERWIGARRRDAYQAVDRAKAREQIRADTDADVLLDMIFGPIYYRLLTGYAPLDEGFIDALVETALNGVAVR
jgi:AcrR family transcriptional regulator